jgi:hypothetical protein
MARASAAAPRLTVSRLDTMASGNDPAVSQYVPTVSTVQNRHYSVSASMSAKRHPGGDLFSQKLSVGCVFRTKQGLGEPTACGVRPPEGLASSCPAHGVATGGSEIGGSAFRSRKNSQSVSGQPGRPGTGYISNFSNSFSDRLLNNVSNLQSSRYEVYEKAPTITMLDTIEAVLDKGLKGPRRALHQRNWATLLGRR